MGKKKTQSYSLWFLLLSSFPFFILYTAGQCIPYILFLIAIFITSLLPGSSSFIRHRYIPICTTVIIIMFFILAKVKTVGMFACGTDSYSVSSICGYVVYDSSFTKSNNHFMTVYLTEAGTVFGQRVSAKGLVNVLSEEQVVITSGIKIKLYGKFANDFFNCDSIQVLSRSKTNDLREFLITEIEKRFPLESEASALSLMLILGRADNFNSSIKTQAQSCGCSHVLALSGMHLNSLSLMFKPVKNKPIKYFLTVIISSAFVFIAGPRPSLIRAYLMLVFSFLPLTEKLVVTLFVQMILFPFSFLDTGCLYSFTAIFALSFVFPVLQNIVCIKPLASSVSVLLMIAPIELISTNQWHPIAIITGPIASVLIVVSMFLGFVILIFGQNNFLTTINNSMLKLLSDFFGKFENISPGNWKGYFIFASCVLSVLLAIRINRIIHAKHCTA